MNDLFKLLYDDNSKEDEATICREIWSIVTKNPVKWNDPLDDAIEEAVTISNRARRLTRRQALLSGAIHNGETDMQAINKIAEATGRIDARAAYEFLVRLKARITGIPWDDAIRQEAAGTLEALRDMYEYGNPHDSENTAP
jgi:hypothetical protein